MIYKELFGCKDYHVLFVEDRIRLNHFQNVHRETVEDPWLNLLTEKKEEERYNSFSTD